jgi:hypothetical protein
MSQKHLKCDTNITNIFQDYCNRALDSMNQFYEFSHLIYIQLINMNTIILFNYFNSTDTPPFTQLHELGHVQNPINSPVSLSL